MKHAHRDFNLIKRNTPVLLHRIVVIIISIYYYFIYLFISVSLSLGILCIRNIICSSTQYLGNKCDNGLNNDNEIKAYLKNHDT